MPLKLYPPRPGKTPNYSIRGTYLGVAVDRTAGTPELAVAKKELKKLQAAIENREWPPKPKQLSGPTFVSAAIRYLQAGGSPDNLEPLTVYFGNTPLDQIDQEAIDAASAKLYPQPLAPSTINSYVYTPVSAVMHHALGQKCPVIRRPKGAKGRVKIDFMWPEDAFAILDAAEAIDSEFGLYLTMLLYTGIRKSEGLSILAADTKPDELAAWLSDSKNGDPRMLKLREDIAERIKRHLEQHKGDRLFRFKDGGHFKHLLLRAKMKVCGLPCPVRRPTPWKQPTNYRLAFVTFHTFRHTWATWMRRYGGADLQGLAGTGNWRDPRSAARYSHVQQRDEWDRVESLPASGKIRGKAVNE